MTRENKIGCLSGMGLFIVLCLLGKMITELLTH